jgi:hypothetical protein
MILQNEWILKESFKQHKELVWFLNCTSNINIL